MRKANRRTGRLAGSWMVLGSWVWLWLATAASPAAERPAPGDDLTFRPTVVVRKGQAQGSGTIIASTAGETLVLTASHVVADPGELRVELHRYNLGVERRAATRERWPRSVAAEVAATDPSADVAILRIRNLGPLPYVARLTAEEALPLAGTVVTSVGIDLGTRLSSWTSPVASVDRFEIEGREGERLFLITARPPEHGRSGGGLFLPGGELVGVCIGRAEFVKGRPSGVFASGASIRRLLRDHDLEPRLATGSAPPAAGHPPAPVTTTRARPAS